MMNSSALRHRVTIQQAATYQQTDGEDVPVWTTYKVVWARVESLTGKNLSLAQANTITQTSTHKITIRYCDGLTLANRIAFGSIPFVATYTFDTLASAGFDGLNSIGNSTGSEESGAATPRIFEINDISNIDERNRTQILTVTEIGR